MKTGIELIAEERQEQIEKHGYSVEEDVRTNSSYQLIFAAKVLLMDDEQRINNYFNRPPVGWDAAIWNRMLIKTETERQIISAALIAGEIDRKHKL